MVDVDGRDERARSGRAARTERRRAARARVERELADLRFVEVPETGPSAFARTAVGLSIALAVGTGATWATLLIAAIVGEEVLWELSSELGFEDLFRTTVLPLFGLAAGLALAIPLLGALGAATSLRLLERHATAHPDEVPSAGQRARLVVLPARHLRRAVLAVAVIAMAVGGFCLLFALADDEGRTPLVWTIVAVCTVLVVAWLIARSILLGVEEGQAARRAELEVGWRRPLAAADLAEERRRKASPADDPPAMLRPGFFARIDRALAVATGALFLVGAVWFVSVWLRQPCKRCDERYFDDPVERFIDGLSLWGGIGIVCALAIAGGLFIARLAMMRRIELAAVRWVADGRPRRAPEEVTDALLLDPRAGLWASGAIVAAAMPIALFAIAGIAGWAPGGADPGPGSIPGPVLVVALAVAIAAPVLATVLGMADVRRAAHERNLLRAALSPGDPDAASLTARRLAQQRRRAKRDRRAQRRGRAAPKG
ncbi:hypothetical protein GCM10009748_09640 [Agromyces lapidis]